MKQENNDAALRPIASSAAGGESTAGQSSAENGTLEDHRTLMTRGELIFCLRHVHRYWSTPRISYQEIEELEQENLIQRSNNGVCAIRLTEQGARVKNGQQLRAVKTLPRSSSKLPEAKKQWENEGQPCADEVSPSRLSSQLNPDKTGAPNFPALFSPERKGPRLSQ